MPRVLGRMQGWPLWQLSWSAVSYLLGVELVAIFLTMNTLRSAMPTSVAVVHAAVLFGLSAVYGEACDRIERLNRYLASDGVVSNQNSVVCFAGVLILPLLPAIALVLAVYGHSYLRARRHHAAHPYRLMFTAAVAVLSTVAASVTFHSLDDKLTGIGVLGSLAVLLSLALYTLCNLGLVLTGLYLVSLPTDWQALLPGRNQVTYETCTLLLGVVTGVLLLDAPYLCPFVLILVAVLHRASLVAELQQSARTDGKTGLLRSDSWQLLAERYLSHAQRSDEPATLLLLDLDHFKLVNDEHGHLAGDVVLRAIATVMTTELRGYDAVGRYGGEEFIALLPGVGDAAATAIGERLRQRVQTASPANLPNVTASIGLAVSAPDDAGRSSLEQLIRAADHALYQAKAAGRDQIRLAPGDRPAPVEAPLPGPATALRARVVRPVADGSGG